MEADLVTTDKAYAKLQNLKGQQYFIRKLPCLISSRRSRAAIACKYKLHTVGITQGFEDDVHALLYLDKGARFAILCFSDFTVNGEKVKVCPQEVLRDLSNGDSKGMCKKYREYAVALEDLSTIYFQTYSRIPELFYFSLPQDTQQKEEQMVPLERVELPSIRSHKTQVDKSLCSKWTSDDRQGLKKLLLQYGYGRWKKLQRSSTMMGGKLQNKSILQIKAYTNSFIRALGMSLPPEEKQLQSFLLGIIDEGSDDVYLPPNPKDWDYQIPLSQRSIQYTKRLQLLNRVKSLVRKYKQESLKTIEVGTRVSWQALLSFIPNNYLFGQRPSHWWAKKHDIDLILGVYKYGYANYSVIKAAREYCFAEFQKANNYQDFPTADNLTRRLKKLMQTIVKIEMSEGKIDFQDEGESSDAGEKGWSDTEKKALYSLLVQLGTPLTADGRSNYMELREKMKSMVKEFDRTVGQLEKMAAKIRWNCQELLTDNTKPKEDIANPEKFIITLDMATRFSKNTNMLSFIRKTILANDAEIFNASVEDLNEKHMELKPGDAAYLDNYDCPTNDLLLLQWINKNGLGACSQLKLSESSTLIRAEWLCEAFKQFKDKNNERKKKKKTETDRELRRRTKFQLSRDKGGNIIYPIIINPSLKLVAIGRVCVLPSYHSEQNLFPIGYVSVRTHASMITKGARANYTCQILQGEGRPIYKVTPEEEPDKPIIKDSSTGCWVYICTRVNQLQEVRKQKVTISGTERFGLLEKNVVRLLEDLPNSEKCAKYKFKFKMVEGQQVELDGSNP